MNGRHFAAMVQGPLPINRHSSARRLDAKHARAYCRRVYHYTRSVCFAFGLDGGSEPRFYNGTRPGVQRRESCENLAHFNLLRFDSPDLQILAEELSKVMSCLTRGRCARLQKAACFCSVAGVWCGIAALRRSAGLFVCTPTAIGAGTCLLVSPFSRA